MSGPTISQDDMSTRHKIVPPYMLVLVSVIVAVVVAILVLGVSSGMLTRFGQQPVADEKAKD